MARVSGQSLGVVMTEVAVSRILSASKKGAGFSPPFAKFVFKERPDCNRPNIRRSD
jgi:hypothetical protein